MTESTDSVKSEAQSLAAKLFAIVVGTMDPALSPLAPLIQTISQRANALIGYQLLVLMHLFAIEVATRRCNLIQLRAVEDELEFNFLIYYGMFIGKDDKPLDRHSDEGRIQYHAEILNQYDLIFGRKRPSWNRIWFFLNIARLLNGSGYLRKGAVVISTTLNAFIAASGLSVEQEVTESIAKSIEMEFRNETRKSFRD